VKRTLAGRLLIAYAATMVAALAVLAVVLIRAGEAHAMLTVSVLAAFALAGGVAVWWAARGVTRPLGRMTDAVRAISAGDRSGRVPADGVGELANLAETLNRMVGELGGRMEEARRERGQLEQILEAMAEGVVLVEADGAVGFANRAARGTLGGSPADLRFLGPHGLRELVEEARAADGPAQREVEIGMPARHIVATGLSVGAGRSVLLVLRDVTAARRVEAMRRDFVADASHELKTPAAAIRAGAETVQRAVEEDPAAAVRFAERLHRDAERLSRIVSDLLDLSRLEAERPSLEEVPLHLVVAEQVESIRARAAESGVTVLSDTRPVTVRGSPRDLRLLVGNLLDNALRYTPAGGSVSVDVRSDDGRAVVTVADTGIGISSRDLPRIFERFYRVDRARSRDTGGTGLGLSIVRHVAEQHGGRVEAHSELGRGSTFRLTLPMVDDRTG
jgi:two-component system phosphate regulon sensor histidine kinase PhoR